MTEKEATMTTPAIEPEPTSGRHRVHVTHLVFGVTFVAAAVVWLLMQRQGAEIADLRWLIPAPLILAGVVGLAAAATSRRDSG